MSSLTSLPNVNHDGLRSSKQARILELELAKKLNKIVNLLRQFIKEEKSTFNYLDNGMVKEATIYQLHIIPQTKDLFQEEVYQLIRSYVERAYYLGASYTATNFELEVFLTITDTEKIKVHSLQASEKFWSRFESFVKTLEKTKNRRIDIQDPNLVMVSRIEQTIGILPETGRASPNYPLTQLSEEIIWSTISLGTIEKAVALVENENNALDSLVKQNDIENRIAKRINSLRTNLPPTDLRNRVKFKLIHSQDERVCKECLDVSKKMFSIDDYKNKIMPTLPLHPSDRCRYLLVLL